MFIVGVVGFVCLGEVSVEGMGRGFMGFVSGLRDVF